MLIYEIQIRKENMYRTHKCVALVKDCVCERLRGLIFQRIAISMGRIMLSVTLLEFAYLTYVTPFASTCTSSRASRFATQVR